MSAQVITAKYLGGHTLGVEFADGAKRTADLSGLVRRRLAYRGIRSPDAFSRVHVDGRTVVWANGMDINPDVLYGTIHRRGVTVVDATAAAPSLAVSGSR